MEVLNISKIKDGLFIGDKKAGTNLGILIQFKISHLINTCGNQISYNYENTGIKYISYNWPENPQNNIIFIKDETSKKILNFIDNSLQKGTGLMIFSIKGQNRAWVAIIIYLMKKYNWSLKKCRDYLSTKKKDIKITKNFLNQLMNYEERLIKKYNSLEINWYFSGLTNKDELLMNNTYLNEKEITKKKYLKEKKNKDKNKINENNNIHKIKPHIGWADTINTNLLGKNYLIRKCEIINDLYFKKNIKPITNHLEMKPKKSCIKYNFFEKESNKKIYLLDKKGSSKINGNKNFADEILNIFDKKEEIRNNSNKTQILKKSFFQSDEKLKKRVRKLTYDNLEDDKFNLKNTNYFEENKNKFIVDSEQKYKNDNFEKEIKDKKINNFFENEKNNSIKDFKEIIQNNNNDKNHLSKSEEKNKLINLEKLLDFNLGTKEDINNFMKNDKYSLYLNNNDKIKDNKKRGKSANKNKNNKLLIPNKRYYLGQKNLKNLKEMEKDIIIPKLNQNNIYQPLNYEYNLNFHNNKILIINGTEVKNNINNSNFISNDNNCNKIRLINTFEEKNNKIIDNTDYIRLNKPKNAYIFNKFNSYNFKPSGPVKINNNMTYRLSHSLEKNYGLTETDNKIFNNINTYEINSKGINISNPKTYKYNRPLSAPKDYLKLKNKNKKNVNVNEIEIFAPYTRLESPVISQSSTMKFFNKSNTILNHNNRYNISTPINNGRVAKKVYKKK